MLGCSSNDVNSIGVTFDENIFLIGIANKENRGI